MSEHLRGCTGKKRYETGVDAIGRAGILLKKFGGAYRPYECPYCKGWHLTTKLRHNRKLK